MKKKSLESPHKETCEVVIYDHPGRNVFARFLVGCANVSTFTVFVPQKADEQKNKKGPRPSPIKFVFSKSKGAKKSPHSLLFKMFTQVVISGRPLRPQQKLRS